MATRPGAAARTPLLTALLLSVALSACAQEPLTPEQIVARLTNAYATCRSFEAIGESAIIVTSPSIAGRPPVVITNAEPFRLQFRRPASLRFEFDHRERPGEPFAVPAEPNMANWPRHRIALVSDGKQTRLRSETARQYWDAETLPGGVALAIRLAHGRGTTALALLLSTPLGFHQQELRHASAVREESLGDTVCFVLAGEHPGGRMPYELWIGQRDFILRKRWMSLTARHPAGGILAETFRELRLNEPIPDAAFDPGVSEDWRAVADPLALLPDAARLAAAQRRALETIVQQRTARGATQTATDASTAASSPAPARVVMPKAHPIAPLGSVASKTPSYIDCHADTVTIYPGGLTVIWSALQQPVNPVTALLDRLEQHPTNQCLVLMVRPGSVKTFRFLRNLVARRMIDVGYDAVDAEFEVRWDDATKTFPPPETVAPPAVPPPAQPPAAPPSPLAVFVPQPRTPPASKAPVFFECRDRQLFFIDRDQFAAEVHRLLAQVGPVGGDLTAFMKAVQGANLGDASYQVELRYALTGQFGLQPRPNAKGETALALREPDGRFRERLRQLDLRRQHLMFLVRDDGFKVYRLARAIGEQAGFECSWEYLGDDPIKFGLGRPRP